jgi:hypothetical protein
MVDGRRLNNMDDQSLKSPDFISDAEAPPALALPQTQPKAALASPDFIPDSAVPTAEGQDEQTVKNYLKFQDKYGTTGQQAIAGLESAARNVLGPLAPMAEKALGVKEEDILNREKANPITSMLGGAAGLIGSVASGVGVGALATKGAARLIPEAINVAEKIPALAKIGGAAGRAAIENAIIATSDETSRMILNDPEQSANTAMLNIGAAGALGGILGGAVGAVSPLFKATGGDKLSKVAEDFKSRLDYLDSNKDPISSIGDNIQKIHDGFDEAANLAYRSGGLKEAEIRKLLPQEGEKAFEVASGYHGDGLKLLTALEKDQAPRSVINKVEDALSRYEQKALEGSYASDKYKVFESINDLKREIDSISKFEKGAIPNIAEADAISKVKKFGSDVRSGLESEEAFGKAGGIQKEINKSFSEVIGKNGPLKQFTKLFMTNVDNELKVDPGKVNTYLNQLGKASAEIKKDKMLNFVEGYENFYDTLDKIYKRNGIENPLPRVSTETLRATTGEITQGAKLADWMMQKGLGEIAGTATGASIGSAAGHGTIGALLGEKFLSPIYNKILPSIARSMYNGVTNSNAIKSAIDYATNVAKGESILNKASKGLFTATQYEITKPSEGSRVRLEKKLKEIQDNPEKLQDITGNLGASMPEHATSISETTARCVMYLNSLKPSEDKAAPLDSKPVINNVQKAEYNNALDIAQQPLILVNKIKQGSITPKDVKALASMYPALYSSMTNKLLTDMNAHMAKGHAIPYKTKIGLSIFTGQPLDSSMSAMSIMSAQPVQPEAPAPKANKAPAASSMKGLQKLHSMYQTPGQTRAASRQKQ